MSAHVVDAQKIKDLTAVVAAYNAGAFEVGLYKAANSNNHATLIGDLTEATFGGYGRISLGTGTVAGAVDGSFRATASWTDKVFTVSGTPGTNDIYGYFVVDTGDGKLAWVQARDDAGFVTMNAVGQTYTVKPRLAEQNNPSP